MQQRGTELREKDLKKKKLQRWKWDEMRRQRTDGETKGAFLYRTKETNFLSRLTLIFQRHPLKCYTFVYHHLYHHLPFCSGFLLFALSGASLGVEPRKEKERILYPLASSILSYDIRKITVIILVLIIILYPHQYLLTLYSVNTSIGSFFFSFLEREE